MNLGKIRTQVVKETGRFDLVSSVASEPYTDNGLNVYINEGQRLLDNLQDNEQSHRWFKKDISAGQVFQTLIGVKAVEEVWIMNATDRRQLVKKALGWLKEYYDKSAANESQGTPVYWAKAAVLLSPEQGALTSSDYTSAFTYGADDLVFDDIATNDKFKRTGILWMPPADGTYTLMVLGNFFSEELSADTDESYWSVMYSRALVAATCWVLESIHRNREGMADYMNTIRTITDGIDKNLVDFDQAGANQMSEEDEYYE